MINVRTEKLDSPTTGFASQRFWCPVPVRRKPVKFGARMKTYLVNLTTILLSVFSGFIVAVAFPPWNQSWLIWVGFTPALCALLLFSRHWGLGLLRGLAFGG